MKLNSEGLTAQLAERLLPVYLVSGDEPLLASEAADAIRGRAREQGFSEREVFFLDRTNASWEALRASGQALSLFASRRIMELRLPSGRPGNQAATLLQTIEQAGDDQLVLILTDKLEREVQQSEWVRAVEKRGGWLAVWPVERGRLPQWLRQRFAAAGLKADAAAIELLAERSEGNLLAARQEIEKLALLKGRGATVSAADVAASSSDSARFDVFQLAPAIQGRDAARVLRILAGLQAEGTEAVLVLWALARELRNAQQDEGSGGRGRLPFAELTARAARADRMAKGQASGDVWDELALLATGLCGARVLRN
ncbi:MAG: DNA polymerase III subunit delta [Steroidobacteraceae bacterium]